MVLENLRPVQVSDNTLVLHGAGARKVPTEQSGFSGHPRAMRCRSFWEVLNREKPGPGC